MYISQEFLVQNVNRLLLEGSSFSKDFRVIICWSKMLILYINRWYAFCSYLCFFLLRNLRMMDYAKYFDLVVGCRGCRRPADSAPRCRGVASAGVGTQSASGPQPKRYLHAVVQQKLTCYL